MTLYSNYPVGTRRLTRFLHVFGALAVLFSQVARGATYVVTNTSDSGAGSLRQAILSANSSVNVPDVISFNISGTGPFTITPATPLPTVTDPVVIDGYTQPGSSPNTLTNSDNAVLQIVLNGTLLIDTSNSVVRGLAVRTLNLGTMNSTALGGNTVQGNFIGLDATGTNSLAGMSLLTYIPNNQIGGTTPAARNVISGHAGFSGVELLMNGSGNTVQGNFIGTDNTGTRAIGNGDRALVSGLTVSSNTIGGSVAGAGNLISGNLDRGITLDGSNNIVQGNFIGTDVTGLNPLGNARTGIEIGGSGNLVGGTNSGAGNIIAFNGVNGGGVFTTNGVDIKPGATGDSVLGNSIFANMGLGIDVNADELITPGFPVLTVVSNTGVLTVISGTYSPSTTFRLELFTNPGADHTGYGEGKTLLLSSNITTSAGGTFTINWPAPLTPGIYVTATGTTNNSTSEFSQDRLVTAAGLTNSWTNSLSGKWETGSNWSLKVPPFIGQYLDLITNGTTKTVTIDATTASGFPSTLTISNLTVSAPTGATNTLAVAQGDTSTPLHLLGYLTLNSGGAVAINNGALSLEGPLANPENSVDGALTLNGGLLSVTNSQLYIGNNGSGSFTVSNGRFNAYYPIVGLNSGANGLWTIAGGTNIVTSVFDVADSLTATGRVLVTGGRLITPVCYVGLFGNGGLTVSNGDFLCVGTVDVASQPGAVGNFTAAGGTSTLGGIIVGESSGATGAVLVTGTALVQVTGQVTEHGSITVTGGQLTVTNDNSFLTHVTVSNGTFLGRDVFLGNGESGVFNVAGSGLVALPGSSNGFRVGANAGTGAVFQAGGQILLTNTDLNIGGLFSPAVGQMTISNGTTLANRVFVGGQGGGTGTLEMDGGLLVASNLQVNATSQVTFNQGTLQTQSSTVLNNVAFQVGDGTHSAVYQLLGGTNLFLNGLRLAANGTLAGSGTVTGAVTTASGSTIAPGSASSIGFLSFSNSLALSGTNAMKVTHSMFAAGPTNDVLNVRGALTLGGTLNVTLLGSFFAAGDTFKLYTASAGISGVFAVTNLPALPGGLGWDTTNLANGILHIIAVVNPNPTNLLFTRNAGNLMLSWPPDHTGWRLLVQTNPPGVGLNPNTNAWFTVPGSSSVNSENITINPAAGTVFYRMAYP
jgi:hypothetical protein